MSDNPLGENVPSPSKYDPGILYPIPRWPARSLLDIEKKLPMYGLDHWHAYELSWLNEKGKPMVALAEFYFDADSENIVESKSLKLYLNSFNQESFLSGDKLREVIANDLSAVSRSQVKVVLSELDRVSLEERSIRRAKTIDILDVELSVYEPDESLLRVTDDVVFDEELRSDLFRSNCPVTGQPDWASVEIQYTGAHIDETSLLAYLCSFREHQGYHEECAERIYRDILQNCQPNELFVAMNFVRRGGIDINVYRSNVPVPSERVNPRLIRQ